MLSSSTCCLVRSPPPLAHCAAAARCRLQAWRTTWPRRSASWQHRRTSPASSACRREAWAAGARPASTATVLRHTLPAVANAQPRSPPSSAHRHQAGADFFPTHLLLLHVRPRALAAGLEVAVHSGVAEDEEATGARMGRHGTLYAVPRTPAGLEAFAADLLATSPVEWDDSGPNRMALPTRAQPNDCGWDSVSLDLLPPSKVRASARRGPHGTSWVELSMPTFHGDSDACGDAKVSNPSAAYARCQAELRRQLAEQQRKAAAGTDGAGGGAAGPAAAGPPAKQPDSDEERERKYRVMRDQAMAELQAALAAMLRQAVRYRGPIDLPF